MTPTGFTEARHWRVSGRVQGVGFRPFVYRLARRFGLRGWVRNTAGQVEIFAQGARADLVAFGQALIEQQPPLASGTITACRVAEPRALTDFVIQTSAEGDAPSIHVPTDGFLCADCLDELRDPANRRFAYPFLNCTQCGPRYTVIRRLPYDRPHTTLADFPLCPACAAEYQDPADRRFHAQPTACPVCGPRLFWSRDLALDSPKALAACVAAIQQGYIVAVKGVGGYHLLCAAEQASAVARLRARKSRPDKPLAVMLPLLSADRLQSRFGLRLSPAQQRGLFSSVRPIVLVDWPTAPEGIAPGLREVGIFLPYSPLHALLLAACDRPLVATSGNVSGEPVLIDPEEAEARLGAVAEAFLHHNRPIARPADDPVLREIGGQLRPLRLGRGNAPLELDLPFALPHPLLALGGHHKNCVALAWENRIVISPHIGDLDSPRGMAVFAQVGADLQDLYQIPAESLVTDAHPGYGATQWATRQARPVHRVGHHFAHASTVVGEFWIAHGEDHPNWLVFTWDGVGLGPDGTLWGGEALLGRPGAWRRVASFRPFHLPGGEQAGREPWRSAAALCWDAGLDVPSHLAAFAPPLLRHAWQRRINCPATTAAGRLFDAAAALVGVAATASFEGQGPMRLEALLAPNPTSEHPPELPLNENEHGCLETDWRPLLPGLMNPHASPAERAWVFHQAMARALAAQAVALRQRHAFSRVGLGGGVFQNRWLAETAVERLEALHFEVFLPSMLPVNDAALGLGQVVEYAATPARKDGGE